MAATRYFRGLTNYRGFSDAKGWRHGVAHTADLLMQMSLNAHLTKPKAEEILAAPAINPAFKESFTAEEWSAWFLSLWPPENPLRKTTCTSQAALTKLHNLKSFPHADYGSAVARQDERLKPVAGAAFAFLNLLP